MQKKFYLILFISVFFFSEAFCQKFKLKIKGDSKHETAVIDSLGYLKEHVDVSSVEFEIKNILNTLYNIGYIESEVKHIKKVDATTFQYHINLKKKFNFICIYYKQSDIDAASLKSVSNQVFNNYFILGFSEIKDALKVINTKISKKGFPFSKLKLSNISIKDSINLKANLTTNFTKTKRTIDNIVIKGYSEFPKSYIKHFLKIKPKQIFDINTIKNKTNALNSLSFADEIKPPEVLFTKDSTALYLYLKKSKSNTFDGFLGFGTNEETNTLEFDGYLNLNLINNLNFGEAFSLLYKSDENSQKTFKADITIPYLLNSPIGVDLFLKIFKKDSSFTTINQSARLHYQINSKNKIYGGLTTTESNNLLKEETRLPIVDYKTKYFNTAYLYIKPEIDNLLFPINTRLYIETEFGNRKTTNNNEKQSQYTIDVFNIFKLNSKNSFYIRGNGSNLISDSYFENELLRFGGINSIRGFEENSLFATLFATLNTEYRLKLNNSIFIHSIIDAGYFENKILKSKEKLFSYGFGFGVLTKAGLLKFNYANGKNENTPFKLSNSKIHLSLTANF